VTRALLAYLPLGLWATAVLLLGSANVHAPSAAPGGTDKVVHFCLYAVGGALAAWIGHRRGSRAEVWGGLAIVLATGLADELHQATLPYRDSDAMDWLADAAGALVAVAVVRGLLKKG
jgi:VanZ family protein